MGKACARTSGDACDAAYAFASVLSGGALLTGAALGYELSSTQGLRRAPAPVAPRWSPVALPMRGGGLVGVEGAF